MTLYALFCGALVLAPDVGPAFSLDEAFSLLKGNHPLLAKSDLEIEQARVDEAALSSQEVWHLNLQEENRLLGGDPANPFGPQRAYGVATRVGLQRDYWSSGGRLELGLDASYLYLEHQADAGTFPIGIPNVPDVAIPLTRDGLQSALSLQYTYPLLQNPGLLKTLAVRDASLKVSEAEFQAAEAQELAMLSVSMLYVEWWLSVEQIKLLEKRLELAGESKRVVVKRQRARLAERVDVLRSEQAVQRALGGLAEYRARQAGIVAELESILGIQGLMQRVPERVMLKPSHASEQASDWIEQTRRLRLLTNLRARLQLQVDAAQERLKPELALIMRAGLKREDFRYTDDGQEGEFNPDAFAGIAFSVPLDRSSQRHRIESASLGQRVIDEEMRVQRLELSSEMARMNAESTALENLLKVKERQLAIAGERAKEEAKMFKLGRTLLNFVIESQDQVQQAKMERLEVLGRIARLKVRRLAVMDLLSAD